MQACIPLHDAHPCSRFCHPGAPEWETLPQPEWRTIMQSIDVPAEQDVVPHYTLPAPRQRATRSTLTPLTFVLHPAPPEEVSPAPVFDYLTISDPETLLSGFGCQPEGPRPPHPDFDAYVEDLFTYTGPPLPHGRSDLHGAVLSRNKLRVWQELQRPATEVNLTDDRGQTPLHLAAVLGDADIFRLLMKWETVDPRIQDWQGATPLHHLLDRGRTDLVMDMLTGCPFLAAGDLMIRTYSMSRNLANVPAGLPDFTPLSKVAPPRSPLEMAAGLPDPGPLQEMLRLCVNDMVVITFGNHRPLVTACNSGYQANVEALLALPSCILGVSKQAFNSLYAEVRSQDHLRHLMYPMRQIRRRTMDREGKQRRKLGIPSPKVTSPGNCGNPSAQAGSQPL